MLDIYSEIFDRFFSYDMKYRKNVPNVLYNILLSHFINVRFEFVTGKKKIGSKNEQVKERASITIPEDGGISSEKFKYKLKNGREITLPARGRRFLEAVAALLFYPDKVNAASAHSSVTKVMHVPLGRVMVSLLPSISAVSIFSLSPCFNW